MGSTVPFVGERRRLSHPTRTSRPGGARSKRFRKRIRSNPLIGWRSHGACEGSHRKRRGLVGRPKSGLVFRRTIRPIAQHLYPAVDHQSEPFPVGPPCTAIVDIGSRHISCVQRFQVKSTAGNGGESIRMLGGAKFMAGTSTRVQMRYLVPDGSEQIEYYSRGPGGAWAVEPSTTRGQPAPGRLIDVVVKQGMNAPPVLVGVDHHTGVSKVIWNPNPQLQQIPLGNESVFRWKGLKLVVFGSGDCTGLPTMPRDGDIRSSFKHTGSQEQSFDPARSLSVRICGAGTSSRGHRRPPSSGLPGPGIGRGGILSDRRVQSCDPAARRCRFNRSRPGRDYWVQPNVLLRHAGTYRQHAPLAGRVDHRRNHSWLRGIYDDLERLGQPARSRRGLDNRRAPFGNGLGVTGCSGRQNLTLNKIAAPLQVVADRTPSSALTMWEPYAGLNYLHKPADFILLPGSGTHVLTNPAQRAASQTGTVDWFRFWLKDEVDPDPPKARASHDRWRVLRGLQDANSRGGNDEPLRSGRRE